MIKDTKEAKLTFGDCRELVISRKEKLCTRRTSSAAKQLCTVMCMRIHKQL